MIPKKIATVVRHDSMHVLAFSPCGAGKYAKAMAWLQKVYQYKPGQFALWKLVGIRG